MKKNILPDDPGVDDAIDEEVITEYGDREFLQFSVTPALASLVRRHIAASYFADLNEFLNFVLRDYLNREVSRSYQAYMLFENDKKEKINKKRRDSKC